MKKDVVLLLDNFKSIDLKVDSLLIAVKNLSCRSQYEFSIEDVLDIKENTNKNIYLLCDAVFMESQKKEVETLMLRLFPLADKVFFSDFIIFEMARKIGCLDKLCYYSPTLALNSYDIEIYYKLGINNVMISKECEYNGYLDILKLSNKIHLGMLSFGYPQIYYSKRKMITFYSNQYNLNLNSNSMNYSIVEKTRDVHLPIIEDYQGTFIFAGEIFFPKGYLKEFCSLGMEMFLIDTYFINDVEKAVEMVNDALENKYQNEYDNYSTFMMFRELVKKYE